MHADFRSLIVLQGKKQLLEHQLASAIKIIPGDWIVISPNASFLSEIATDVELDVVAPNVTKLFLGREFKHAIFDATEAFNLDAFAIIAGTLMAGSVLLLLLPNEIESWHDQDSLRWNDQSDACLVPHFITHLMRVIQEQKIHHPNNIVTLHIDQQHNDNALFNVIQQYHLMTTHHDVFKQCTEQSALLHQQLLPLTQLSQHHHKHQQEIVVLTAKRGRGKSALAGMFARYHSCWVTASNKNAVTTLMRFAQQETVFYAPDALIDHLQQTSERPHWLIIDEAAMIPLPIVKKLIEQPYHVLLTTTVDGYEGTGQGLLLKLLDSSHNKHVTFLTLKTPIRWCNGDPLESFIDQLLIADHTAPSTHQVIEHESIVVTKLTQNKWVDMPQMMSAFFSLLKSAHYRTTLIDLRRLLDAKDLDLYSAQYKDNILGVLVAIKEGRLDAVLVDNILAGYRRPRGNLVAQSLVAHAGEKRAAILSSIRINRIAIIEDLRRRGIASQLISQLINDAITQHHDFVSVSFSYSSAICSFWLSLGFVIVHVGTHQEASSGSHAIMAIYPITEAGQQLAQDMQKKLARNWYWLHRYINIDLPFDIDHQQQLTVADKKELLLFATTAYAYSASIAVLSRLAYCIQNKNEATINQKVPLLLDVIANMMNETKTVMQYQLSGKKELIKLLREEVHQLIMFQGWFNE